MAAQKKSQKKASSTSAMRRLTDQEYTRHFKKVGANLADAVRAVERLEMDLKRIKSTLRNHPFCPTGNPPFKYK